MCDKNEKNIIESFKAVTCMNGECGDDDLMCHCNAGYIADMVLLRQRDCNLNIVYIRSFYTLLLFLSIIFLFYSIYSLMFYDFEYQRSGQGINNIKGYIYGYASNKKENQKDKQQQQQSSYKWFIKMLLNNNHFANMNSVPTLMLSSCIVMNATMIILCLHQYRYEYRFTTSSMFLLFVASNSIYISAYFILYSLTLPLFKLSNTSEESFRSFLISCYVIFRVCNVISLIISASLVGNSFDMQYDKTWNTIVSIILIIFSVENIFMVSSIVITCKSMLHTVQDVKDVLNNQRVADETKLYIKRIQNLLKGALFTTPTIVLCNLLLPSLYFAAGYAPFSYIIYSLTVIGLPPFTFIIARFVQREHQNLLSTDTSKPLSGKKSKQSNVQSEADDLHSDLPKITGTANGIVSVIGRDKPSSYMFSEMTTVNSIVAIESTNDPQLLASTQGWKMFNGWIELKGPDGLPIYFHPATKMSSFDPPEGFNTSNQE